MKKLFPFLLLAVVALAGLLAGPQARAAGRPGSPQTGSPEENEDAALGAVRLLITCAITYMVGHHAKGFPASVSDMWPSGNNCLDATYGEPVSEGKPRRGYRFTYRATNPLETVNTSFEISARPVSYGVSGTLSFYADESGVIRSTAEDRAATYTDPAMKAMRSAERRRKHDPDPGWNGGAAASLDSPPEGWPTSSGNRARQSSENPEARAVGFVRLLINCAITYQTGHPDKGFPRDVHLMGMDGDKCIEAQLDTSSGKIVRQGYLFTYRPTDLIGSMPTGFEIVARPEFYGGSRARSFVADESGVIRFTAEDRAPTVKDGPLP